jgi:hypothetical protein
MAIIWEAWILIQEEVIAASYAANGQIATNDVLVLIEKLAEKMKLDPSPILAWAKNERRAFS